MIDPRIEIALIMMFAAVACALLGTFLVLRKMALLSDAIGHVLLFGIVIAFFYVEDLKSPWLMIGAALSGLLAVGLIESLQRAKLVKEDAAIGLVFPALFSGGILLASMYFRNTHLDVDQVLLGFPELAPLRRITLGSFDLGPTSLVVLVLMTLVNLIFILVLYKELKISTFDAGLATTLGFLPVVLHYSLMGLVSLTAVTTFDAVGPVLVVAFMIVPPASAYLVAERFSRMLMASVIFAALGAAAGTATALFFDTNIAGTAAVMMGIMFVVVFCIAPRRGLIAQWRTRLRQKRALLQDLVLVHLHHHEGTAEVADECRASTLHEHLRRSPEELARLVQDLLRQGLLTEDGWLRLTPEGRYRVTDLFRRG